MESISTYINNATNKDFRYRIVDGILIVEILDALNYLNEREFSAFLDHSSKTYKSFIFDLSDLSYINSTCLGHILRKSRITHSIIVNNSNSIVRQVLNLLDVNKVVPVVETMDEAIRILGEKYGKDKDNSNTE